MQVASQLATVVVRAIRETDLSAKPHTRRTPQAGLRMSQPACNWKTPDRHVELLNFETEAANVLQAAYDLSEQTMCASQGTHHAEKGCILYRLSLMQRKRHAKVQQDCLMY